MNLTERAQLRRLQRILQDTATEDHEARMFADLAVSLILASYEGRRFMREFRAELGSVPSIRASVESGLPACAAKCDGCGLVTPTPTRRRPMAAKKTERPVIICTEFKGVFFGYSADTTGDIIHLKRARMAIYWGGTKGVMRLAEIGPQAGDRISARADLEVRKITAVMEVTPAAVKAWEAA